MILAEETLLPCGAQAYWAFCSGKQETKGMRPVKSDLNKQKKTLWIHYSPSELIGEKAPLKHADS